MPAMKHAFPASRVLPALLLASLAAATAQIAAQTRTATPAKKTWTQAKTPDGQPDLQGIWTNATITPFERPASMAGKEFLTAEEAAKLEHENAARRQANEDAPRPGDVGSYNEFWFDSGTRVVGSRRTSLVIDPPDGRVPLQKSAEQARDFNLESTESFETMSPWDRCITRGPGRMFPAGYNNAYQIVQTPGYVMIAHEMIHEARLIPIDGRPHLDPSVRLWTGDPRGRWEGRTLVVETTNFNDKGWIATNAASARIRGVPHSDALRLVERFTRVDADTIDYQVTVDDSKIFTRSWTVTIPLTRDDSYQIFEYACHEGNRAIENVMSSARRAEQREKK